MRTDDINKLVDNYMQSFNSNIKNCLFADIHGVNSFFIVKPQQMRELLQEFLEYVDVRYHWINDEFKN